MGSFAFPELILAPASLSGKLGSAERPREQSVRDRFSGRFLCCPCGPVSLVWNLWELVTRRGGGVISFQPCNLPISALGQLG